VGTDPLRESAQRALIESHLAEGNRIEAHRGAQGVPPAAAARGRRRARGLASPAGRAVLALASRTQLPREDHPDPSGGTRSLR
jgi:hypothetical protein